MRNSNTYITPSKLVFSLKPLKVLADTLPRLYWLLRLIFVIHIIINIVCRQSLRVRNYMKSGSKSDAVNLLVLS